MTDLIQGIAHTVQVSNTTTTTRMVHTTNIQGIVESLVAIVQAGFHVAYTFVHGLLTMLWNTIDSFATFLGASVNFVFCELAATSFVISNDTANIILLVVLVVFFIFYRSSNSAKAAVSKGTGKKKAE